MKIFSYLFLHFLFLSYMAAQVSSGVITYERTRIQRTYNSMERYGITAIDTQVISKYGKDLVVIVNHNGEEYITHLDSTIYFFNDSVKCYMDIFKTFDDTIDSSIVKINYRDSITSVFEIKNNHIDLISVRRSKEFFQKISLHSSIVEERDNTKLFQEFNTFKIKVENIKFSNGESVSLSGYVTDQILFPDKKAFQNIDLPYMVINLEKVTPYEKEILSVINFKSQPIDNPLQELVDYYQLKRF